MIAQVLPIWAHCCRSLGFSYHTRSGHHPCISSVSQEKRQKTEADEWEKEISLGDKNQDLSSSSVSYNHRIDTHPRFSASSRLNVCVWPRPCFLRLIGVEVGGGRTGLWLVFLFFWGANSGCSGTQVGGWEEGEWRREAGVEQEGSEGRMQCSPPRTPSYSHWGGEWHHQAIIERLHNPTPWS